MASNPTDQVRSISEVTKAVVLGDLSKLVNVDACRERDARQDNCQLYGGVTQHFGESLCVLLQSHGLRFHFFVAFSFSALS